MTYLDFLDTLLKNAGNLAMSFPSRMSNQVKGTDPNQVVTEADVAIGDQIRHRILDKFPCDTIIDEEFGVVAGSSHVTWIIDPIDGTANFAAGSPHFGVMVGVLEHGEPVAGGVSLPAFSETYVAEAGRGAFLDGALLTIGSDDSMSRQLIAYGMDIHPSEIGLDCRLMSAIASRCRGVRMSNSVFDCMMVAKNVYAGFMHRRNHIWDCVAPHVIIQEAGGRFSAMDGSAINYKNPLARSAETFSILACEPRFHASITASNRGVMSHWELSR